jgi:hypothetical protein
VPLYVPQMYVYVVSYCFGDTFVSLVVFSSTVSIFPFAPSFFIYYIYPSSLSPGLMFPSPVPFDFMGLLFNHLFAFFVSLSATYYLFKWLDCSCALSFFVWGPPGLLATGSCYWVGLGLRLLNAAFPCWSSLPYFIWIEKIS